MKILILQAQIPRNFNGFKKIVTDFIVSPYFFIYIFVNNVIKIINLIIVTLMLRNQGCGLIEHEFLLFFFYFFNISNDAV